MTPPSLAQRANSPPSPSGVQSNRLLIAILSLYVLFLVYGSLVPLHFTPRPPGSAWTAFLALPGPGSGLGDRNDWAVNLLLLVPLAFGLRHVLTRSGGNSCQAALRTVMLVPLLLLFSVSVEFAQAFFPPRNPSWDDVAAQACGTLLGLGLHQVLRQQFERWLAAFSQSVLGAPRLTLLLGSYLSLMLIFSVMPLDLTLSPVEIYRKWRDGRVLLVPFSGTAHDVELWLYELLTDVALWVPVGLLWRIDGRGRSLAAVLVRVLLAAFAIEAAQLFVLSRVTDVTDVILAVVGGWLGAASAAWVGEDSRFDREGLRRVAWLAWGLWLIALLVLLWYPFDFKLSRLSDGTLRDAATRTPFLTYFIRSEFGALNEILRKLLFFLPGGLLLGVALAYRSAATRRGAIVALVGLAAIVEVGQSMLPARVADATDFALQALGGWLGLRLGAWLAAELDTR